MRKWGTPNFSRKKRPAACSSARRSCVIRCEHDGASTIAIAAAALMLVPDFDVCLNRVERVRHSRLRNRTTSIIIIERTPNIHTYERTNAPTRIVQLRPSVDCLG